MLIHFTLTFHILLSSVSISAYPDCKCAHLCLVFAAIHQMHTWNWRIFTLEHYDTFDRINCRVFAIGITLNNQSRWMRSNILCIVICAWCTAYTFNIACNIHEHWQEKKIEKKKTGKISHAYFQISDYMDFDGVFSSHSDNQDIRFLFASSFSFLHSSLHFLPFYWIQAILLRLNRCILCPNTVCFALLMPQISFLLPICFNQILMPFYAMTKNSRLLPSLRFTLNFHADNLFGLCSCSS